MNLPNLERLKAAIRANADSINMGVWAELSDETACGSVGCAAGECDHLMAVDGREDTVFTEAGQIRRKYRGGDMEDDRMEMCRENGRKFLGIEPWKAARLFHTDEWPSRYSNRLLATTPGTHAYAEVICERLDYFADTGE